MHNRQKNQPKKKAVTGTTDLEDFIQKQKSRPVPRFKEPEALVTEDIFERYFLHGQIFIFFMSRPTTGRKHQPAPKTPTKNRFEELSESLDEAIDTLSKQIKKGSKQTLSTQTTPEEDLEVEPLRETPTRVSFSQSSSSSSTSTPKRISYNAGTQTPQSFGNSQSSIKTVSSLNTSGSIDNSVDFSKTRKTTKRKKQNTIQRKYGSEVKRMRFFHQNPYWKAEHNSPKRGGILYGLNATLTKQLKTPGKMNKKQLQKVAKSFAKNIDNMLAIKNQNSLLRQKLAPKIKRSGKLAYQRKVLKGINNTEDNGKFIQKIEDLQKRLPATLKYKKAFSGYAGPGWEWVQSQRVGTGDCPEKRDELKNYGLKGCDQPFYDISGVDDFVGIPVKTDTDHSAGRDLINAQATYFNPALFPATRKVLYKYLDTYRVKNGKVEKY